MTASRVDVTIGLDRQLVHKEVHLDLSPFLQCFFETIQSLVIYKLFHRSTIPSEKKNFLIFSLLLFLAVFQE